MKRLVQLATIAAISLTPFTLQSQTNVRNPSNVEFVASPDHVSVDEYQLDILRADNSVVQTLSLGKPVPNAQSTITAPLNVQPVAFGIDYSVRVRARAGTAFSDYAVSVNKFDRVPGGPSKVSLR